MKTILVFAKRDDALAHEAKQSMISWLKKKNCETVDVTGSEKKITAQSVKDVTLGVVFGGDGTFLTLVRRLERKDLFPLMGVNLGTLGFITETGKDEIFAVMEEIFQKKYTEELRTLMRIELLRGKKSILSGEVFNDAVLSKDAKTSMLSLEIHIEGNMLSHVRADGYIVSTATGSTGHALSAGGALLHPCVEAFLLIPVCSHSLTTRPIVIPKTVPIEIWVKQCYGSTELILDGNCAAEIQPGDKIRISASPTSIRLIHSHRQNWAQILRTKLQLQ